MVDTGIRPIVSGSVTNMAIGVWGGDTSQTASHGLGVASIIKPKFGSWIMGLAAKGAKIAKNM